MPGSSLAAVANAYLEACVTWDQDSVKSFFSPNICFHFPGTTDLSGEHQGLEALWSLVGDMIGRVGASIVEIDDTLVGQDQIAFLVREAYEAGGNRAVLRRLAIYTVRDGKFVEGWTWFEDQATADSLLAYRRTDA